MMHLFVFTSMILMRIGSTLIHYGIDLQLLQNHKMKNIASRKKEWGGERGHLFTCCHVGSGLFMYFI